MLSHLKIPFSTLTKGFYDDNIFHVLALGFPPAETSDTTRAYFGNINFFGGPSETSMKNNKALAEMESNNPDAMFVFVSDVWLDQVSVMDRNGVERICFGTERLTEKSTLYQEPISIIN